MFFGRLYMLNQTNRKSCSLDYYPMTMTIFRIDMCEHVFGLPVCFSSNCELDMRTTRLFIMYIRETSGRSTDRISFNVDECNEYRRNTQSFDTYHM